MREANSEPISDTRSDVVREAAVRKVLEKGLPRREDEGGSDP